MAVWKDLKDFSRYQVSDSGFVRTKTGKMIQFNTNSNGYTRVSLYSDTARKYKQCLVHRLVLFTFEVKPAGLDFVNHKDGNKKNNTLSNLEFCSRADNMAHCYSLGLKKKKLADADVALIKASTSTNAQLAEQFNVHISFIRKVRSGKYQYKS